MKSSDDIGKALVYTTTLLDSVMISAKISLYTLPEEERIAKTVIITGATFEYY